MGNFGITPMRSPSRGRDACPEPCPAHLGQWPTFFISARAARRFTKSSATAFDHRLSRFAGSASKTFRLLTKAIGLPIGKRALDLSGQNGVVCPPLSRRLCRSFAQHATTMFLLPFVGEAQRTCSSSSPMVRHPRNRHIGEPAEFRNRLLTRIPDFWLRSLLCRNSKHVLR